jgi:DNA-3-methyladenine glycosylase I
LWCNCPDEAGRCNVHKVYHDLHYGFPIDNDDELFCRLFLEINQAGLSWTTILKNKKVLEKPIINSNIKKVAGYKDKDVERLLNDAGIIRNKLKVNAAIENAKTILGIQKEFGSFKKWLDHHHPKTRTEWTHLFKKTFRFTGW